MDDPSVTPVRPERTGTPISPDAFGVVEQPLTLWERAGNNGGLRKTVLLILLAAAWESYARMINNPLLVPTFSATLQAFWEGIASGVLPGRTAYSIRVLIMGYPAGVALAALLTACAVSTRVGTDLLETLSSMFNPLPAIALLPLALLWFGLGNPSLMFVMVHSVLWPVALNTHSGVRAVSNTAHGGAELRSYRRPLHLPDERNVGVGRLSADDALALGVTGPVLRSAGVATDVRKDAPYCGYQTYDFDVPVRTEGDAYARYRLRIEEMRESMKIVRQCLERLEEPGPVMIEDPKVAWPAKLSVGPDGIGNDPAYVTHIMEESMEALIHHFKMVTQGVQVPAGEVCQCVESPRGELGFYVVSDGGHRPYRARSATLRS